MTPVSYGRLLLLLTMTVLTACAKPAPVPQPPAAAPAPEPMAEAPPVAPGPVALTDAAAIASAQRMLVQLGYDAGKPDGIAGAATRRAVQAFQKDHALTDDGLITKPLVERLKAAQAAQQRSAAIALSPGDTLIYSNGSVEIAAGERTVEWDQAAGKNTLVAVRPATAQWPPAARAGLDWAISHALDQGGTAPTQWSSTGVEQRFEIRTFALSPREAALAGGRDCRRFEMRDVQRHYPAIACRDKSGNWVIAHSKVRLARPATELGRAASVSAPRHD